jgi:hemerythrin-like domain-containing protein
MIRKINEDDIPLTEDLMKEHGILNRVLLIYEEIIKRIDSFVHFEPRLLQKAIEIIKTFIEEYHEKQEEDYLFPLFEKNNVEVEMVRTLKEQHIAGRKITRELLELITQELTTDALFHIKSLLHQFIDMYRPHEAREDTVLFPQVRSLLTEQEFEALGKKFEEWEHQLFGEHGFKSILAQVEDIEKQLGIYKLDQFTPLQ